MIGDSAQDTCEPRLVAHLNEESKTAETGLGRVGSVWNVLQKGFIEGRPWQAGGVQRRHPLDQEVPP